MKLKGISLPVNAVIIIALAVMVLLLVAAFFFGSTKQLGDTSVESAWNQGCNALRNTYHCDASVVGTIKTADITGDGVEDSLLTICRVKYHNDDLSAEWCRNKCCGTVIVEGSPCTTSADCQMGWGKANWACTTPVEGTGDRCCSSSTRHWNESAGTCQ